MKSKKRLIFIAIIVLMISLVSLLAGCNHYVAQTAGGFQFEKDKKYNNNLLSINAGDLRKFEIFGADGIIYNENDYKDFKFEIDQANTIYETGDIQINGREFIVPADTLNITLHIKVFYKDKFFEKGTIVVENKSIIAKKAKEDREEYYKNNVNLRAIERYYDALENGEDRIKEREKEIKKCLDIIEKTDDPKTIEIYEEMIADYKRDNENDKQDIIDASAFIAENEGKYNEYLDEMYRLFLLYHQPVKGVGK